MAIKELGDPIFSLLWFLPLDSVTFNESNCHLFNIVNLWWPSIVINSSYPCYYNLLFSIRQVLLVLMAANSIS